MEQFCVLFRRVLRKPPQKHFAKHISYLREAMKMYSKLLRGAKLKTLRPRITSVIPEVAGGGGGGGGSAV